MQGWQADIFNVGVIVPILLFALIASIAFPAPQKSYRAAAVSVMTIAIIAMLSVFYLVLVAREQSAALLVAAGAMLLSCLATWLGRGIDPDDDNGGGGPRRDWPKDNLPGPDGADFPDWDWDDFDQQRGSWDRQPVGR